MSIAIISIIARQLILVAGSGEIRIYLDDYD
jgi:hypothetical protein